MGPAGERSCFAETESSDAAPGAGDAALTRQRISTATLGALTGALLLTRRGGGETASSAEAPPFVFRSLELRQKKPTGDRDWDLTSPEARYEFNRRMIRARRPDAVLYTDNRPSFEIRADLATVLNDGALVLLEGAVEIQQLEGQRILIKGDRLRWTPALSLMVIEQGAEAVDTKARLLAETARFNQITQDLTMAGSVQLERWKEAITGEASDAAEIFVRSQRTVWNLGDGTLHADGPVYGERREDENRILQQLHADRLQGNTQQGFVRFHRSCAGPVSRPGGSPGCSNHPLELHRRHPEQQRSLPGLHGEGLAHRQGIRHRPPGLLRQRARRLQTGPARRRTQSGTLCMELDIRQGHR